MTPDLRLLELADRVTAERVLDVQRRAYRAEADLIGDDRIPPLHETLAALQACGETFLGATVDGDLAGFVSWKLRDGTLDLHRLAVDPPFARRGIGRALVRAAIAATAASHAIVQTGAGNGPAKALYHSEGFVELGDVEVIPGLFVTRFERTRPTES